jgi:hypothetical protein
VIFFICYFERKFKEIGLVGEELVEWGGLGAFFLVFRTVKIFHFKLSKFFFSKLSNFPFQNVEIFHFKLSKIVCKAASSSKQQHLTVILVALVDSTTPPSCSRPSSVLLHTAPTSLSTFDVHPLMFLLIPSEPSLSNFEKFSFLNCQN